MDLFASKPSGDVILFLILLGLVPAALLLTGVVWCVHRIITGKWPDDLPF